MRNMNNVLPVKYGTSTRSATVPVLGESSARARGGAAPAARRRDRDRALMVDRATDRATVRYGMQQALLPLFNVTNKEDGGVSRTGRFAIKYCMVLGTERNIRRTVRRSARPESYRYTYSCVPWDFRVRTCARYVLALGL